MSPCDHAERLLGLSLNRIEGLMYYPKGTSTPHKGPLFVRIFAVKTALMFATLADGSVGAALDQYHDDTVMPDGATLHWETWKAFAPGNDSVVARVRTIEDDTGPYGCALELSDGSIVELRNEGDEFALDFLAPNAP
jgi:hypothetical protein